MDRMLSSEIDAEEAFVTEMESPMNRAFIRAVAKRPEFVQGFLRLLGDQLTDEDIKKFTEGAAKQSELGEERQRSKRGKRKRGKEATA